MMKENTTKGTLIICAMYISVINLQAQKRPKLNEKTTAWIQLNGRLINYCTFVY